MLRSIDRIEKPWGYELILAHTDRYVGKILHVDAGHALDMVIDGYDLPTGGTDPQSPKAPVGIDTAAHGGQLVRDGQSAAQTVCRRLRNLAGPHEHMKSIVI